MIEHLLRGTGEWLSARGPDSDIVITSRVRLARNLTDWNFTSRATDEQSAAVRDTVLSAARDCPLLASALYFDLPQAPVLEQQLLVERHLISHNLLTLPNSGALIRPGEAASVMINEEDHLRITAFASGLQLEGAYDTVSTVERALDARLDFAFHPDWGYLTACPTNAGTGMRASVLVHLPGLIMTKRINTMLKDITGFGLAIRGYYGEGTESIGNFFQLSNQKALGQTESEMLTDIRHTMRWLLEREQAARRAVYARRRHWLEDRVWRAYGLLTAARLLKADEAMEVLSDVRLGVSMGIITALDIHLLNEIFLHIQPAHLQYYGGSEYADDRQDYLRARLVREKLKGH